MPKAFRRVALASALALVATLFALPAGAATTLQVQEGAFLFEDFSPPAEGYRFYAPALTVMKGDTINFSINGFHTATLLPVNTDVHGWVPANAGGVGKPWSLATGDPDDTGRDPGSDANRPAVKVNNRVLFPSQLQCGPATAPCRYDGTQVVHSGIPFSDDPQFAVTLDGATLKAGDVIWVICLIHPHMRLKITITDDPTKVTTQAAIDEFRTTTLAQDRDWALATHNRLNGRHSSHVTQDGRRVHDVYSGFDNHWVTLLQFYPNRLRIRKGDTVRYHFSSLVYEDHTVSMPLKTAFARAEGDFTPACDPDGDAGTTADTPPQTEQPPFCTDPTQLEIELSSNSFYQQGDGVFRGADDFENSGIRGAQFRNDLYDVRFARVSPDKGWKGLCLIHPGMRFTVIVRPRR